MTCFVIRQTYLNRNWNIYSLKFRDIGTQLHCYLQILHSSLGIEHKGASRQVDYFENYLKFHRSKDPKICFHCRKFHMVFSFFLFCVLDFLLDHNNPVDKGVLLSIDKVPQARPLPLYLQNCKSMQETQQNR